MNEPKVLILTTNRTEDGAPVYAPCGDLREFIAKWREAKGERDDWNWIDAVHSCADELEAALKPHGDLLVARPLQIDVSYPEGHGDGHEAVNRAVVGEE